MIRYKSRNNLIRVFYVEKLLLRYSGEANEMYSFILDHI